jgi:type II secretory pathway component PulF
MKSGIPLVQSFEILGLIVAMYLLIFQLGAVM